VVLETKWVLRSRYSLSTTDIAAAFTDCLIGSHHRALGCRATASFDAKAPEPRDSHRSDRAPSSTTGAKAIATSAASLRSRSKTPHGLIHLDAERSGVLPSPRVERPQRCLERLTPLS
jgi:hypothetical protein